MFFCLNKMVVPFFGSINPLFGFNKTFFPPPDKKPDPRSHLIGGHRWLEALTHKDLLFPAANKPFLPGRKVKISQKSLLLMSGHPILSHMMLILAWCLRDEMSSAREAMQHLPGPVVLSREKRAPWLQKVSFESLNLRKQWLAGCWFTHIWHFYGWLHPIFVW